MKLKTWQKWGIAFGMVHVLVCMVFLYLRRYDTGHPSIMVLLLIIDTPIAIIGKYFFGRLFYNNEYFYFYYLLIAGTLFYFVIGVIVGQILKLIKHSRMDFKTNHITCSVILLTLLISNNLFAYSGPDHHRHMGVRAADESDLDTYLKDNLGFSKGINTTLTNPNEPEGEQTKKIFEWIGYGSEMEDVPPTRADNHFYDPVTNQGLSDYPHWFPVSSRVWAREHEDNDYSWAKAREYYYLALTSRTKEERERYWALMFRSLGQVLHLIQDLASPPHVRNDNHGPVGGFPNESLSFWDHDPYEDTWGTSQEGISFIRLIMLLGGFGNTDYQYSVVELDRFEDYWDTEGGMGLAEFTNSNFVSKDTNVDVLTGPHHYDNPQPTGLHNEPFEFTDSNNVQRTVNVTYYTSNVVDSYAPGRSVNPFNYLTAVSYWNFYTRRHDPTRIHYTLNRKCHEEYAKLLVPRTVGYGAGLLNYFFRGRLEVDIEVFRDEEEDRLHERKFRLIIRPISEYSFAPFSEDNFEIYYDTTTGLSYLLRNRRLIADVEYRFEGDAVIAEFPTIPYQDGLVIGFTIVYHGELGEEEIVIGRDIFLCPLDSITGVMNGVAGIGNESIEDQQTRYNALRIQTREDYFSETALSFAGVLEDLHVYRIDYWSPGYGELFEIDHVAIRSYAWARTEIFSTINSAKLIGFKQQVDTPLDEPPLELTAYFYKVPPWADAPLISDASVLWTRMEEPPRELLWSESTEGMVLGVYYPLSIEFDPGVLLSNEPLFLEIKSDKEWIDYTPIAFPPPGSFAIEGYFAFSEIYFVIDGTLKEIEEQ